MFSGNKKYTSLLRWPLDLKIQIPKKKKHFILLSALVFLLFEWPNNSIHKVIRLTTQQQWNVIITMTQKKKQCQCNTLILPSWDFQYTDGALVGALWCKTSLLTNQENVSGYVCNPGSLIGNSSCVWDAVGTPCVIASWSTCIISPMERRDVIGGWRHRPGSYKAALKTDRDSFCAFSKRSVYSVLVIFIVVCQVAIYIYYGKKGEQASVVLFPAHVISRVGTHTPE